MTEEPKDAPSSAWSPLRQPLFRALWIAAAASNIGTLMQNVGAAWLMTALAASPLMVALVQTATTLPVFLLGLPAGALADVIDRRRLLLFTQWWMLAAAGMLGMLTLMNATTSWVLLSLTFLLGLGNALNGPAWQAIISDLVSRDDLPSAVALNSVGFNLARAVGPMLGGFLVAAAGSGVVFLLNAASFLGVIAVLFYWRRPPRKSVLPTERVMGAIRIGVRYIRHVPALRGTLLQAGIFSFFATALLALLPLLARIELGLGSDGYGALLGAFGAGAIIGAALLPRVRNKISTTQIVRGTTILFALVIASVAYLRDFPAVCAVMVVGGLSWLMILSLFNSSIQISVPAWVRGRALSFYLLIFFGGMAGGGALWGTMAEFAGIPDTLLLTSAGLIAGLFLTGGRLLTTEGATDTTPSLHWPEHTIAIMPEPDSGPVLVMLEYRIDPGRAKDFADAMKALGRVRRRDGAMRWGLFQDTADPSRYFEIFAAESWAEHLRQHERVTIADREIENSVRSFHIGEIPPRASHLIYTYGSDTKKTMDFPGSF